MSDQPQNKKRFVSWAAVSSLPQAKKISLSDQLRVNAEHIERWDGTMVEELVVPGESRNIVLFEDAARQIDAYKRLKELINEHRFDVLIYMDRSRLGRKASLSMAVIELCHEAGIITYATESPPNALEAPGRNFHSKIVGAIESVIAQEEITKIQHRHEMGMIARVKAGSFPNKIPYGWTVRYEVEDGKPVQYIEVNEEAKEIIEYIYDLYLNQSASVRLIRDILRERGVPPPRGTQWTDSAVTVITKLALRYAGFVELNVRSKRRPYIIAPSKWPALVSEEVAKAVQSERLRRMGARRTVGKGVHRFSQVVYCQKCDRRLIAHYTWKPMTSDPTEYRCYERYRCEYAGEPSHPKAQIAGNHIANAIRRAVLWVQDDQNRQQLLTSYVDRTPKLRANIASTQKQLEKIDEAVQRADDAYVLGNMNYERYAHQLKTLDERRAKVERTIADLEAEIEKELHDANRATRLEEVASEGIAMLEIEDTGVANAWFRRHIRVWVNNDDEENRIVVEYL